MTNPNHTDTSRSGDLVERLHSCEYAAYYDGEPGIVADEKLLHEAADRIEVLEAEVERLRAALGKVRFLAQVNYEQNDNLNSRGRRDLLRIVDCARAALGEKQ
jgi:hypothetical protein